MQGCSAERKEGITGKASNNAEHTFERYFVHLRHDGTQQCHSNSVLRNAGIPSFLGLRKNISSIMKFLNIILVHLLYSPTHALFTL
jgi:hypothetical protein